MILISSQGYDASQPGCQSSIALCRRRSFRVKLNLK